TSSWARADSVAAGVPGMISVLQPKPASSRFLTTWVVKLALSQVWSASLIGVPALHVAACTAVPPKNSHATTNKTPKESCALFMEAAPRAGEWPLARVLQAGTPNAKRH